MKSVRRRFTNIGGHGTKTGIFRSAKDTGCAASLQRSARFIPSVSLFAEPVGDLPDAWIEMPEASLRIPERSGAGVPENRSDAVKHKELGKPWGWRLACLEPSLRIAGTA